MRGTGSELPSIAFEQARGEQLSDRLDNFEAMDKVPSINAGAAVRCSTRELCG